VVGVAVALYRGTAVLAGKIFKCAYEHHTTLLSLLEKKHIVCRWAWYR
jgi:hypothetical protein